MDLSKLSDQKLINKYTEAGYAEEGAVAEKMAIREEFKARLEKAKLDSKAVGDYSVIKYKKVTFKTKKPEAEALGAIKTKKVVDTKLLRSLYDKGIKVPGVNETTQVTVRRVK